MSLAVSIFEKVSSPISVKAVKGMECIFDKATVIMNMCPLEKINLNSLMWKSIKKNCTTTTVMWFVEDFPRSHCLHKIKSMKHPHRETVTGGIKYHTIKTKLWNNLFTPVLVKERKQLDLRRCKTKIQNQVFLSLTVGIRAGYSLECYRCS